MTPKSIALGIYECSVLTKTGIQLPSAFEAIAQAHRDEPEVQTLFKNLHDDWMTGQPSLQPFIDCVAIQDDLEMVTYFAQLAAQSTSYDSYWADIAAALLLKQRLLSASPTAEDIALGKHLLSFSQTGSPIETSILSYSKAPEWQEITKRSPEDAPFPEAWWGTFHPASDVIVIPPTIALLVSSAMEKGMMDSIPPAVLAWTRYVHAYESVEGS